VAEKNQEGEKSKTVLVTSPLEMQEEAPKKSFRFFLGPYL